MQIIPVPQLADNYAYLLIDSATRDAGVVDCAEADAVLAEVQRRSVRLRTVLATHHHFDHVGGNQDLLAAIPDLRIYGSTGDGAKIPGITDRVDHGDHVQVGGLVGDVISIPAHTSGHLAYYFPTAHAVFTGDTLFAAGCGRLFEGDAAQMKSSLARLTTLPPSTAVYCGHEYTQRNLEFALTLEPGNRAVIDKLARVRGLRENQQPTIPSSIAEELETNPFLRMNSPELATTVRATTPDQRLDDEVALFAAVRALKDRF